MTTVTDTDKPRRQQPRFITAATERMLRDLFPGLIPARVVEEAVRLHAIRTGRLPTTRGGRAVR